MDADCGSAYWSASCLTSSIHPFIYFPPLLTLSPFIIQLSVYFSPLFLPHFPPSSLHSPSVILPCQNDHLSRVYMCVCVCISVLVQGNISVWPVVRAKDCLYYRLLLGDRETTNSESEWVYVCLIALTCVFVLACLGLFLCELGSVLVWESLSVSLSFSEANLLSEGHHSSEEQ